MSFSCIFSQYKSKEKDSWKDLIDKLSSPSKELLRRSIDESPRQILSSIPISPAKNDMNWACYFATGNLEYLNNIIHALKHLDERQDMNLFLTAASAQWSLSVNSKKHTQVRATMMAMKAGDVIPMRTIASDILAKGPQVIRDETIAILKAQKESGAW